ncbi:MAG: hypothetical protein QOH16_1068 [Gaiellaceae bacterium]|jgi:uncharacterized protein with FMN-binding domain|nr:hypothetical protein [Gaiellaceae bacterium]
MRKAILLTLSTAALAVPSVNAWAASRQVLSATTVKKKVVVATRSFTGAAAQADRWGSLQVTIVVKKTTTTVGTKKTVTRKITAVKVPVSPNHTDRSIYINQQAIPYLVQETLKAQSSKIYAVSGATDSSYAFASSLQAAIVHAKAW